MNIWNILHCYQSEEDTESEDDHEKAVNEVDKNFKRKANESPENKDGFVAVSNSKKGKKKAKKSLNKSK